MKRKIIQISFLYDKTFDGNLDSTPMALCDDGTVWHWRGNGDGWVQSIMYERIPQPEEEQ